MSRVTTIAPSDLTRIVEDNYQIDAGIFPETIQTPFGQVVALSFEGCWVRSLHIEHVGYKRVVLGWGQRISRHPLLEWAYRSWAIERMQCRIDVRPASLVGDALGRLRVDPNLGIRALEDAICKWVAETSLAALAQRKPQLQIGLRVFVSWALEEEVPGFSEITLNKLLEIPLQKHGAAHLVSIFDAEAGPHSLSEMRAIESALDAHEELIEARAIFYLGRDWGLRPIQIALMRVTDVGEDALGPYVLVPGVKGIRRSSLRRYPTNLKKRHIELETHCALQRQVERGTQIAEDIKRQLISWSVCTTEAASKLPIPLFPAPRTKRRSEVIANDDAIVEYLLHSDAAHISRVARAMTTVLNIPRKSPGVIDQDVEAVQIGLQRLRRTKGTSMVLSGATPVEVAEALDHETVSTIAHYFKFNRDIIEYLDALQSRSQEIRDAAAAWAGKLIDQKAAGSRQKLKIGKLGLCSLGRPCPHHPTVSCYSCQMFEPYIDGDHLQARTDIQMFKRQLQQQATGPVSRQIDAAMTGVEAVISAIKELRYVESRNQECSSDDPQ